MRTQLRRQAAAHMDHVQDVLKVQEQELRADAEQVSQRRTTVALFFSIFIPCGWNKVKGLLPFSCSKEIAFMILKFNHQTEQNISFLC